MRLSKTIKLSHGLHCTVREFSVGHLIDFFLFFGRQHYDDKLINDYIINHAPDLIQRSKLIVSFNKGDFEILIKKYRQPIFEAFLNVNSAYFGDEKSRDEDSGDEGSTKYASFYAKKIMIAVEVLIREGHGDALKYGWTFFNQSLEFQEKLLRDNSK